MTAEKPEVDFYEGEPPTDLEITDIVVGDGAEATVGDQVLVHYVGVAHSTGEEFDASTTAALRWTSRSAPDG
jgi:peptidylprolyl isomerase